VCKCAQDDKKGKPIRCNSDSITIVDHKNSTDHNIWWYEPCIIEIFEKKRRNMSKKAEKRIREGEKMFYGKELTYDRIP